MIIDWKSVEIKESVFEISDDRTIVVARSKKEFSVNRSNRIKTTNDLAECFLWSYFFSDGLSNFFSLTFHFGIFCIAFFFGFSSSLGDLKKEEALMSQFEHSQSVVKFRTKKNERTQRNFKEKNIRPVTPYSFDVGLLALRLGMMDLT